MSSAIATGLLPLTTISQTRDSRSGVNPSLTPNRRKRVVENDEYAAFVRRVIDAYSRRIANGDIEAIKDLAAVGQQIETAMHNAITGLRTHGFSWADIAARLGITRQAAQQRWGNPS